MKKIDKRRRREGKTNYEKRIKMLKGNLPRLVFRKTNRYLIAQYVLSKEAKDKIILGINSKSLLKFGWPEKAKSGLKSVTASYLLGLLIGKKIKDKKIEDPIVDLGMIRNVHKSKTYGFLKGLIDAGIKIDYKEGIFPEENRLKGDHLKNKVDFEKIKSGILK